MIFRHCAVLPLLVMLCNQLIVETMAQNDSSTSAFPVDVTSIIVPASSVVHVDLINVTFSAAITNTARTNLMPTAVISTVEVTSPDMTPVDVFTLTDMLNVSTVPVPLSPTNTIMMTSLLSMSSSFIMTIGTTAMASPVDTIDTSSIIVVITTVTMASSSNVQSATITTVTASKRNPVPAEPSDSDSEVSSYES